MQRNVELNMSVRSSEMPQMPQWRLEGGVDWIVSNWKWDKEHSDMLFTIIKVKHTRKTQKNHTSTWLSHFIERI